MSLLFVDTAAYLTNRRELEAMLDCQIATTADLSLLRASISRPKESIITYPRLRAPYLTELSSRLKDMFKDLDAVQKLLAFAREASSELGEWCSDHVWRLALKDEEARKMEHKTERLFQTKNSARSMENFDADLERIREAQDLVQNKWHFQGPITDTHSCSNSLSPKVNRLKEYLDLTFRKPSGTRCIVFVRRRYTARLLVELLAECNNPLMRLGVLIGSRYGESGDVRVSYREQIRTLKDFKNGGINCLVSPSKLYRLLLCN